jgi:hypothetical protein
VGARQVELGIYSGRFRLFFIVPGLKVYFCFQRLFKTVGPAQRAYTLANRKTPGTAGGKVTRANSFLALILLAALTRLLLSALLSRLLTALAGLLTRLLLTAAALLAALTALTALTATTLVLLVGALLVRIHTFTPDIAHRRYAN